MVAGLPKTTGHGAFSSVVSFNRAFRLTPSLGTRIVPRASAVETIVPTVQQPLRVVRIDLPRRSSAASAQAR